MFIRIFLFFISWLSIVEAHGGELEGADIFQVILYIFFVGFPIIGIFMLLIGLLLCLSSLCDYFIRFIVFLVGVFIFSFVAEYSINSINLYIQQQERKPEHDFAQPYTYGVYKESNITYETNGSIIDIDISDGHLGYLRDDGILTCWRTERNGVGEEKEYVEYIDVKDLLVKMADCHWGFSIVNISNKVYWYREKDATRKEPLHESVPIDWRKQYKRKTRWGYNFKITDRNHIDFYRDHLSVQEQSVLRVLPSKSIYSVMDIANKQLVFFLEGCPIHTVTLMKNLKLALYDQWNDIVYVVYQDEPQRIYVLNNILTYSFVQMQNRVKKIIDAAYVAWWQRLMTPFKDVNISVLEKIASVFPDNGVTLSYTIQKISSKRYGILVKRKQNPLTSLEFIVEYDNNSTRLVSFNVKSTQFENKQLQQLVKKASKANKESVLVEIWFGFERCVRRAVMDITPPNSYTAQDERQQYQKIVQKVRQRMERTLIDTISKYSKTQSQKFLRYMHTHPCLKQYIESVNYIKNLNLPYFRESVVKCDMNETEKEDYQLLFHQKHK